MRIRRIIAGIIDNILILYAIGIGTWYLTILIESTVLPWITIMSWLVLIIPVLPIFILLMSQSDPEIVAFLIFFQFLYYWLERGYYYICYNIFNSSIGQWCMGLIIVDSGGERLSKQKKWERSGEKVLLRYTYYIPIFPFLTKKTEYTCYDKKLECIVISRKEYRKKYKNLMINK